MSIFRVNQNLVISWSKVQLWKLSSSILLIQQFINYQHKKTIFDGDGIKSFIIHTKSPSPIFLLTSIGEE